MKVLIVDDEPLARARLRRLLEAIEDVEIVGEAGDGTGAIELGRSTAPELILMDIRMPGIDGLEAARRITAQAPQTAVVFTTAYDEHALAAFEASAIDYLLKPIREDRLKEAIARAARLSAGSSDRVRDPAGRREQISATTRTGLRLIPVRDIRCFRADRKYVTVHHADGEDLIEESLKSLEQEFGDLFTRVHRNALVADRYILALRKTGDGKVELRLSGCDVRLEVSRRHLSSVKRKLRLATESRSAD